MVSGSVVEIQSAIPSVEISTLQSSLFRLHTSYRKSILHHVGHHNNPHTAQIHRMATRRKKHTENLQSLSYQGRLSKSLNSKSKEEKKGVQQRSLQDKNDSTNTLEEDKQGNIWANDEDEKDKSPNYLRQLQHEKQQNPTPPSSPPKSPSLLDNTSALLTSFMDNARVSMGYSTPIAGLKDE